MKTLSNQELQALTGQYFAPKGLYQYIKRLPFLGTLNCDTTALTAGQWTEIITEYTVGGSGLADGAWIKGTFKFYSDWALFQTTDPTQDNYLSAEYVPGALVDGQTPATVQSLSVRFDQKGHERPFQKAIIIDIVDGYLNPGDKIVVRIGDRRWGSKGTRVQTFVEKKFLMRWYIDPVGTSRFAPIKPDIAIAINPGEIAKAKLITPRVVRPSEPFPVHIHAEDAWGNATTNLEGLNAELIVTKQSPQEPIIKKSLPLPTQGWTVASASITLPDDDDYEVQVTINNNENIPLAAVTDYITATPSLPIPRPLFADLHVHSDDTVGTNDTTYNFAYGQQVAGLDIIGYTANDFNITKEKWDATLELIKQVNSEGNFVVYPGTEWCGNSAAGGDHNVVFLDDPSNGEPEFPFDKHGNAARSFEWNEDGPAELVPGAWPLDEVYATYAHSPEKHLLIPHVGGRRCNLAWHHPQLERLLEIGSAWGLFEWLLRDAVKRGWKLGVSANSDEHRGRCGGGVPGTAVFGTKGGLTGVLADRLDRKSVATALRARRTFATTGERLVGLVSAKDDKVQGDDVEVEGDETVSLKYGFYGSAGFSSVEAWDGTGKIYHRDLQQEATQATASSPQRKIRIKWGGARLYDRYREAIWHGSILIKGAEITSIKPFGGIIDNPEEQIAQVSSSQVTFTTHTSGDFDGVDIFFAGGQIPDSISVTGQLGGYVKVGNALTQNPHKPQPTFSLVTSKDELEKSKAKDVEIAGGAELVVSAELLADVALPRKVEGEFTLSNSTRVAGSEQAVYVVGREYSGGKIITSPVFLKYA